MGTFEAMVSADCCGGGNALGSVLTWAVESLPALPCAAELAWIPMTRSKYCPRIIV